MIKGIVAGVRTLIWAIVLLCLIIFAVSMVLRQTIGEAQIELGEQKIFNSVPSTMFSVFRMFMGDNSLADGTPMSFHLVQEFGGLFGIPYTLVVLFIVFGIFNMIAALFVENVMATANAKRQLTIEGERARVAKQLRMLVLRFAGHNNTRDHTRSLSEMLYFGYKSATSALCSCLHKFAGKKQTHLRFTVSSRTSIDEDEWSRQWFDDMATAGRATEMNGMVTRDMFMNVIHEPDVEAAFDELEIFCSDRTELFDLLDADGSGTIDISELVSGLMKLRSSGTDTAMDSVATYLGIRAIQNTLTEFKEVLGSRTPNVSINATPTHQMMKGQHEKMRNHDIPDDEMVFEGVLGDEMQVSAARLSSLVKLQKEPTRGAFIL